MIRRPTILIIALCLIALGATEALAKPKKGFLTGPYLTLEIGLAQIDYDTDQVTGQMIGNDIEPTFGFLFGWNIYDPFSVELQGRYATNPFADRRMHIANANVYGKWHFILDALTDFKTFRIIPFLKGGAGMRIGVLPGSANATNNTVIQLGYGPSFGGGISFLWHKYFYFGIDVQEDLFIYDEVRQNVSGVPNTLVYRGGFHPSLGAMVILGVHY